MNSLLLPDVQYVNVNHRVSRHKAITRYFQNSVKQKLVRNLLISVVTLGIYPYREYKKAKKAIAQAFAARKLFYFKSLQDHIEKSRQHHMHYDPRSSINAIFMKVQSEKVGQEEGDLEFKAIYYPSELLLFITNPIRDKKSIRLHRMRFRKQLDYFKIWYELKKRALVNQYRQIQKINFCNKTLKEEYALTSEEIHDRLSRASISRKSVCLLTKFKELGKAFQEIVIAYQDFEELSDHNAQLFNLIKTLSKTSERDIEILQTYLASRHLPRNLPLENRRQLIRLANQQDVLYHMSEEEQFTLCALILNKYQWDFLLSIQEVSQVIDLLDWAFEESPSAMKRAPSFLEQLLSGIGNKVKDNLQDFPSLNEKIRENPSLSSMTLDFAKEINRVWPSFSLYDKEELVFHVNKIDSFTMEKLVNVYLEIQKFCATDNQLFCLLQQALSQVGKHAFQLAIEAGILELLGEKSEYFLPILSNSDIRVVKEDLSKIEIFYSFEQLITKKGEVQQPIENEKYMVIAQPLKQEKGHWVSPEPKIEVKEKGKVS